MSLKKNLSLFLLLGGLTACAHDNRDGYVLGAATASNVASQSVRDVTIPNSKPIEETSGTRAVNAMKALNAPAAKDIGKLATATGSTP